MSVFRSGKRIFGHGGHAHHGNEKLSSINTVCMGRKSRLPQRIPNQRSTLFENGGLALLKIVGPRCCNEQEHVLFFHY
jgi:hypothetical protein